MHFVFIYPQLKNLTGAQRLILELAGAIANSDSVTLLTHTISPACRQAIPPAVKVVESGFNLNRTRNHYVNSLLEYLAVPSLLKRIRNLEAENGKVNAICFFGPPSLPGLWWGKHIRRLKMPLLYFCYEPPRAAYTDIGEVSKAWAGKLSGAVRFLFRLYRPLDRYLARQASAVLVNGLYAQSLIKETYNLPSVVITHGADLPLPLQREEAAQRVRQKHGLDNRPLILTVNHLHPRKRIALQLEALALLQKTVPEVGLLVVGSGPEAQNLKQQAAALGLSEQQVIFAGFVADSDLPDYYVAAQVYLHSGRAESFGLAVLEGSAAGLPVVAADEGGPREIITEGETGFLVPATAENFAEKLTWLLTHPAEATEMGHCGALQVSQRYTWAQGASRFVEAVSNLLSSKK